MTRFSETEKWRDPWFRSLKPPQKLLFLFVIDNCNNAGFWEEDKGYAIYCTGMNEAQYSGALEGLKRGLVGADGWLWVRKFLKHQRNLDLNPKNNAHSQIIRLLREQKLRFGKVEGFSEFLAPYEGLLSPTVKYSKVKSGKEEEVSEKKPPSKSRGTQEEFEAYAVERNFPASDGSGTYDHFVSNGWMLGKAPVKDWRAAFRTRAQNEWLPSQQKRATNGSSHRKFATPQVPEQPKYRMV